MEAFVRRKAAAKIDKVAENIPHERWMDRMKKNSDHESAFWAILEKGRLADLSQFHRPHLVEEVPLYTRLSDIAFLSDLSHDEINETLLAFSLKFLNTVISYENHKSHYVAAITIWNFSDEDRIVPNLFIASGFTQKLHDILILSRIKSSFGKGIKRLLTRLHLPNAVDLFEDSATSTEMARVFLSPLVPPYKGFVPLAKFLKPAGYSKR